jgi:hypothetical protein
VFYDLGDPITLAIDTSDAAGNPANAGTVALTIDYPDDTTVSYTPATSPVSLTNPAVGRYELQGLFGSQVGAHYFRWVTTGVNATSYGPDLFDVRSASGRVLLSLSAARNSLNKSITGAADEEELRETIDAATAPIEDIIGPVAPRTVVEVYRSGLYPAMVLRTWPVISVASVEPVYAGGDSYDPVDLDLDTELGVVTRLDGGVMVGPLRVTYRVGRRVVDPAVREAGKVLIRHMWDLQRGSRGGRPGFGEDPGDVVPTPSGFLVPRRCSELLFPFRRPPNLA